MKSCQKTMEIISLITVQELSDYARREIANYYGVASLFHVRLVQKSRDTLQVYVDDVLKGHISSNDCGLFCYAEVVSGILVISDVRGRDHDLVLLPDVDLLGDDDGFTGILPSQGVAYRILAALGAASLVIVLLMVRQS